MIENKTKKTCTKGYSCGLSCINVKLSCTKDGLKGQFVTLTEEYLKKASEPSQQKVVEEPKQNIVTEEEILKNGGVLLGEGLDGKVYEYQDKAIKIMNRPDYVSSYSGNEEIATKAREADRRDFEKSVEGYKIMADLGVSPKVFESGIYQSLDGKKDAFSLSMENLGPSKGYQEGLGDSKEIKEKFISQLKKVHDAGYFVDDLKYDNMAYNDETNDVKFLDQGSIQSNKDLKGIAEQLLDSSSWRPDAHNIISSYIAQYGSKEAKREFKKLVKDYSVSQDENLRKTEPDDTTYKSFVDRFYSILGN